MNRKPWTKRATRLFDRLRFHLLEAGYYLRELSEELNYRPADSAATELLISGRDQINAFARQLWLFLKKHNRAEFDRHFPKGADWDTESDAA